MSMDFSDVIVLADDLAATQVAAVARVEKIVSDYGDKILAAAQAKAPVRTGALRGSITKKLSGLRVEVEADEYYGFFQEYGTADMAPQPFMEPALAANEEGFAAALERAAAESLTL